jgi:hypothetical protein
MMVFVGYHFVSLQRAVMLAELMCRTLDGILKIVLISRDVSDRGSSKCDVFRVVE